MPELELVKTNLSSGYGFKKLHLKQDETEQDQNYNGTLVSGELALGIAVKDEVLGDCLEINGKDHEKVCKEVLGEFPGRVKAGLDIVKAQMDTMIGQANDKYMRFALDLGLHYHSDVMSQSTFRMVYGSGITARLAATQTSLPDGQNVSGSNWNVNFPVDFGLGVKNVFVQDSVNLMINVSSGSGASFAMRNEVSLSARFYANYYNRFIQTLDFVASNVYELGKISGSASEKNSLWSFCLKIGGPGFSLPGE